MIILLNEYFIELLSLDMFHVIFYQLNLLILTSFQFDNVLTFLIIDFIVTGIILVLSY